MWQTGSSMLDQHKLALIKADSAKDLLINATVTENVVYSGWQSIDVKADVYTSAFGNAVTDDLKLYGAFSSDIAAGDSISCIAKYRNGRYTVESYGLSDEVYHSPLAFRLKIQKAASEKVFSIFRGDAQGVAAALITGDRSGLSDDIVSNFRKSSLSHILVVSGMHLVIISHSLSVLLGRFISKKKCALTVLVFCWLFAAISGFGVSIVRAAIMMTVMQVGAVINRRGDTLTSLALAAIIIVLPAPKVLVSTSFLLSFSAVAGLALLQKPICDSICDENSNFVVKYITQSGSAAAAAQLATAPVCAVMFGSVSIIGVAANLAAVWLIQPIMALGIISLALGFVHAVLAYPFAFICEKLISLLVFIARIFADIPFGSVSFTERWQIAWLFGSALMLIILYCRFGFKGSGRFAALMLAAVYALGTVFSFIVGRDQADLLLFDEGSCAAVVKGGHAVLIGAPQNRWQLLSIQSAFDRMGVEQMDYVVIQNSEDAGYDLAKLIDDYDCRAIICQNDRAAAAFCNMTDTSLYQYPQNAALFDDAVISADNKQTEIIFNNCKLLKNQDSCDIIGMYTLPLPVNGAERIRITL